MITNNDTLNQFDEMISLYEELSNLTDPFEIKKKKMRIEELKANIRSNIEKFTDVIEQLKNSNFDNEKKIEEMQNEIDKYKNRIPNEEFKENCFICSKLYSPIWNELDDLSKDFLATAYFLSNQSKARDLDQSPVIIEYCRAFENELIEKIYKEYIEDLSYTYYNYQYNKKFSDLIHAVDDYKAKGYFFVSSKKMIDYLGYINDKSINSEYKNQLIDYLRYKKINVTKIANDKFINQSKYYVKNYRNKAAHPNKLSRTVFENCKNTTRELLTHIISSTK